MQHSLWNRLAICASSVAFIPIAGCGDEPSTDAPSIPPIAERFRPFAEALEAERQALGIPGLAVAILQHGELAFAQGFGTKGIGSEEPVGARTIFRTGSMGKVVTALGVMSAVDDGLLDLDAPIRAAIPDLSLQAPETEQLTLRRLMSQQSGLRDYISLPGPSDDAALAAFTSGPELAENVDFINPPGLFWNYSNPNFTLTGRALEAATATPYRQAIHERVFEPLAMQRSFFLGSEVIADGDYSNGYGVNDVEGDGPLEDLAPDAYENTWARPAGFAFSNVLDWTHLMQFLIRGDRGIVSDASHDELVASQISTQSIYADLKATALGLGDDYGFGIGKADGFFMDQRAEPDTYYAMPYLGHGGDIPGFASTFFVFPSTGFGIVVLSNRDAARPVESLRLALESFGELPAPSTPPAGRDVDPSRFASYAGSYVDTQGTAIEVRLDAGALHVSSPQLDEVGFPYDPLLEPTSLDNFALWVSIGAERFPLEVTFIRDPARDTTWFRSRLAVARRMTAPAAVP
jgi:CubicO group peptidase (beta-lactamase class C family)